MSKYFIYYSASGNGDYLASLLKEKGYEPVKIELVKPIKKIGFFTILKYGGRAMANKKENIQDINIEFKDNDEIIIGSPIWNDRLSTPVTTFLRSHELNKEKTSFIVYPAGESTKKSLEQIKKMGYSNEVLVISYPLKKQEQAKQILGL